MDVEGPNHDFALGAPEPLKALLLTLTVTALTAGLAILSALLTV
jgi:hypothetical protein